MHQHQLNQLIHNIHLTLSAFSNCKTIITLSTFIYIPFNMNNGK